MLASNWPTLLVVLAAFALVGLSYYKLSGLAEKIMVSVCVVVVMVVLSLAVLAGGYGQDAKILKDRTAWAKSFCQSRGGLTEEPDEHKAHPQFKCGNKTYTLQVKAD